MKNEIIKDRLQQILDEQRVTKTSLAKIANVTAQAVNNWFNNGKVSTDSARAIAEEFGYSVDWILGGSNTIVKGNSKLSNSSITTTTNVHYAGDNTDQTNLVATKQDSKCRHRIDYLDVRAAAGMTGFINSDYPEIISSIYLSDEGVLELIGKKTVNGIYLINVPTDSMEPTIQKGAIVIIDTRINHYIGDGIYAFSIDDNLFIKRLQKLISGGYKVISDNKDKYDPEVMDDETLNKVRFVGKFIRCWNIETVDL